MSSTAIAASASAAMAKPKKHSRILMGCWQLSTGHRMYASSQPVKAPADVVAILSTEEQQPPQKIRKKENSTRPSVDSVLARAQWHVNAAITTFDMVGNCEFSDNIAS